MWGPYLAGRQWGTVREDYSPDGNAWASFPFDHARARAYRWGEDGLGGVSDRFGFLNFAVALWNRRDPILKERLFGLTNSEGNHGEDVKEYWWVIDGTPTHSWMQWRYRYPQAEYPYQLLREENARRGRDEREFELADTGVLDGDRFFDVDVMYAKAAPDDLCITISATNHGPDPAPLDLLPQAWLRNTWAWGRDTRKASMAELRPPELTIGGLAGVHVDHGYLGQYFLAAEGLPAVLFCGNETNAVELFGAAANRTPYTKDGIDRRVVRGDTEAVNPANTGTKVAFHYSFDAVAPGETVAVRLRLSQAAPNIDTFGPGFAMVVGDRRREADEFYDHVIAPDAVGRGPSRRPPGLRRPAVGQAAVPLRRRPVAVRRPRSPAAEPGPAHPRRPQHRLDAHVARRRHLDARRVGVPLVRRLGPRLPHDAAGPRRSRVRQGTAGADVPGVGDAPERPAARLRVGVRRRQPAGARLGGLARVPPRRLPRPRRSSTRVFTKLLLNFSWWVNRKDADGLQPLRGRLPRDGQHRLFNRSAPLPPGYRLEQSDATSWMAFYCQQMFKIAVELSRLRAGVGRPRHQVPRALLLDRRRR